MSDPEIRTNNDGTVDEVIASGKGEPPYDELGTLRLAHQEDRALIDRLSHEIKRLNSALAKVAGRAS